MQHVPNRDWLCFWMTVGNVLKRKGVIEGKTGRFARQMEKQRNEAQDAHVDGK